jgi:predicted PurR-regulated permease PerM
LEWSVILDAKRYRLALVVISLALVVLVLLTSRGALFPFMLSGAIAYVLFPLIKVIEKRVLVYKRWEDSKRLIAVAIVYLSAIGVVAGIGVSVIPAAFEQGTRFVESVPEFFADARTTLEQWAGEYADRVPEQARDRIQEWLEGASDVLIDAAQTVALRTLGTVANVLTAVLGFAVVPLFLFFALKDGDKAIVALTRNIPGEGQRHATNVLSMVNQVFAAYLRAQLTLALFVAVVVSVGLSALGIPNALLLGIVAGTFEFIPIIGPLLGFIPGVVVTLAAEPQNTLWVALLYGGVQAFQNAFLVPRVQGKAVDLHPALIMVVIVVGSEAAGLLGVVLAVPVTAATRNVFRYFYREWSKPVEQLEAAQPDSAHPEATDPRPESV